jgi:hypothetical protein
VEPWAALQFPFHARPIVKPDMLGDQAHELYGAPHQRAKILDWENDLRDLWAKQGQVKIHIAEVEYRRVAQNLLEIGNCLERESRLKLAHQAEDILRLGKLLNDCAHYEI